MNCPTFRNLALGAGLVVGLALSASVSAQPADAEAQPQRPRTYALVGAMGQQLSVVFQTRTVGSHLPPYVRDSVQTTGNILDRMALRWLDEAVAKTDPKSQRVYLALSGNEVDSLPTYGREDAAIAKVVEQLSGHQDRQDWYRIVVVTPAYRVADVNGLATRLQGMGMFVQPIRGGTFGTSDREINLDQQAGETIMSPVGKEFRSQAYVAPFSYVAVWVLDPRTMAVLDKQRAFKNQKFGDPMAMPNDAFQGLSDTFMVAQMNELVGTAVSQAVEKSELGLKRGTVTVVPPAADSPAPDRSLPR
jgi:hypothetical protein